MRAIRSRFMGSSSIAAVIAFCAASGAFAQAQAPKWSPWVEAEVSVGDGDTVGALRGFQPLDQTGTTLLFLDGSLGMAESSDLFGSFGVGARGIVNDRLILGASSYLTMSRGVLGDPHTNVSFGVEALTENFDVRANYYHVLSDDRFITSSAGGSLAGSLAFEGNRLVESIGGLNVFERAYSGVEGEAGAKAPLRLPFAGELRAFAGGFRYTNDLGPTIAGPRGRAELQFFDFFGSRGPLRGARLSIGGEVTDDKVRGTEARAELRLRMPFGLLSRGQSEESLSALERRMTDRVERDQGVLRESDAVDTRTSRFAHNPGTGAEYVPFYFSDGGNSVGAGNIADPTTFNDAVTRAGGGGIIVVLGGAGNVTTPGATLFNNQSVFGGGSTIPVLLANGTTVNYSLGLLNGVLQGTGAGPVITLGGNNLLQDFSIAGGSVGIGGSGINNFTMRNMSVNSPAGIALTGVTGLGAIHNSSITSTAGTGIYIDNSLLAPGAFTLTTTGTSINSTGGPAIDLDPLTLNAVFTSITASGGATGIALDEVAGSFTVTGPVNISNTTGDGISLVNNTASVNFQGLVTITNPGDDGIEIDGPAAGPVSFANVDVLSLGANRTGVDLTGAAGPVSFTTLDVTGVSNVGTRGVDLRGAANAANAITAQSGTITGVNIGVDLTNAAISGIFQYGDGSNTDGDGAASTINAVTPIVFTGVNPGFGTYDFEDVNLIGDTSNFATTIFWALQGAAGAGTRLDPGSLSAAEAAAVTTIVLLNNPAGGTDTLNALASNGNDTLLLDNNQRLFGFAAGDTITGVNSAPANILTFGVSANLTNPFAGSGSPNLVTTGAGANTITLGNGNSISGLTIGGGGSAIFGSGVAGFTFEDLTINAPSGINLTSVTGAGSITDSSITTTAGIGLRIDNSALLPGDFTLTTTGTAINATGGAAVDLDPLTVNALFTSLTSTGGVNGILLDGVEGTFNVTGPVNISGSTGNAIRVANGGVDFTLGGATTITNPGLDGISLSALTGTVDFNGGVTVTNAGADGVRIEDSENATVAFDSTLTVNGAANVGVRIDGTGAGTPTGSATFTGLVDLDSIDVGVLLADTLGTTTFGSIDVTNVTTNGFAGSTMRVGGTGTSVSNLTVTGGGRGIILAGADPIGGAGITFGTTTLSNNSLIALDLASLPLNAAVGFTGLTTITNPGLFGIDIGDVAGGLDFADVDITALGANRTGVRLTSAAGATNFATLDITGASAVGTRGIDLTGANNAFNTITVDSGTITGVGIGVDLTNANNTGNFQYGDGSNTDGDAAASTINATTPIVFTGINAANGLYDFEDVNLVGDTSAFGGFNAFWVLDGATGVGSRLDPGSLAAAELSAADTIVLLNNPAGGNDTINATGSNGNDELNLDAGQRLFSFRDIDIFTGTSSVPVNLLVFGVGGDLINPFTGSGAPTLTTTSGYTLRLGDASEVDGLIITGTSFGIGATGVAGYRVENSTLTGFSSRAIDIGFSTGTQVFENLTISDPTASVGAILLSNASGTLMLTDIDISSAGANWSRAVTIDNGGGASSETLALTLFDVDVSDFNVDAIGVFFDQGDGGSVSITESDIFGDNAAANGLFGRFEADWNGTLSSFVFSSNRFTGSLLNAIAIDTFSGAAGTVTAAAFSNNDLSGATVGGIGLNLDFASNSGSAFSVASMTIANNLIGSAVNRTGGDGLFLNFSTNSGVNHNVGISGNTIFSGDGAGTNDEAIHIDLDAGSSQFSFQNNTLSLDGNASAQEALFFDADSLNDPNATITSFTGNTFGAGNEGGLTFFGSVNAGGAALLTFDATLGGAYNSVNAGSMVIGTTGARVSGDGLSLTNVQGILSFDDLDIANTGGFGIEVDNSLVTAGKDFTFNVDAGDAFSATVDTVSGTAIFLDPLTVDMNFDTVTATGGANGIVLDGVAGTFDVSGATTLTNTTGFRLVSTGGSTGVFTFGGPVTLNAASLITGGGIDLDSGTLVFNGLLDIDDTNLGIGIDMDGGTLDINDDLSIDTLTAFALDVAGGTITIDNSAGDDINLLATSRTVSLVNAAIGAGGVGFDTVTSSNGQLGTLLENLTGAGVTFDGAFQSTNNSGAGFGLAVRGASMVPVVFNGTVTVNQTVGGVGGLDIDVGTVTFNNSLNIDTTSGAAVDIDGGTVSFLGGGLDIDTTSGIGFDVLSATINVAGAGNTVNTTTGRVLNWNGALIGGSGVNFATLASSGVVAGTGITLNDVDGGVFSGGNVTVAGTTGAGSDGIFIGGVSSATFNFASATIDNTFDDGIDIDGAGNGAVTYTTVDLDGMTGSGVEIDSNTGTVAINGGTIGATNDSSGASVIITGGNANIDVAANLFKTTSGGIANIINRTGGTVTLSGNLSANGTGTGINADNNTGGSVVTFSGASKVLNTGNSNAIALSNSTGGTYNFTGGNLDIDANGGRGLQFSGGGTLNVTGASNTILTTTAQGITLNDIIIGGSGVSFQSIGTGVVNNANALNFSNVDGGVFTVGPVTVAGTTVSGDGIFIGGGSAATFSFGTTTIDNTFDDGIEINGAGNGTVTFATVDIDGTGQHGANISGNTGTVAINGGAIGATNDPAGRAVSINGGSANIDIASALTKTTSGNIVNVQSRTGGVVTLSGNLSATGGVSNGISMLSNSGGSTTFSGASKVLSIGGATAAVSLGNNTGHTINFTGGGLDIDTITHGGFEASGGGTINITGAGNTINTSTGPILNLNGGIVIGGSGVTFDTLATSGIVSTNAIQLNDVDGGVFNGGNVTIAGTSAGGDGIFIGGGAAATFNFASATIDNTAGDGIDIDGAGNGTVTFTTVDLDGMTSDGVEIDNNTGVVNINGGSIGATNDPSAGGVNIAGGSGDITIAASVTKTSGNSIVDVTNRTGGTVTLSGNISATGGLTNRIRVANNTGGTTTFSGASKVLSTGANTALELLTNTGHTINFTNGGLDIDTTTGTGLSVSGGGTVNITGANNTINIAGAGQAVNFQNTTIGASGIAFQSITQNAGVTAINLLNTGTSGGFSVTGDVGSAVNGSGGTLSNLTGDAIILDTTMNFSIDQLNMSTIGTHGIDGENVNGISVTNATFTTMGGATADDDVFSFDRDGLGGNGLIGTALFSNLTLTNFHERGIDIVNEGAGSLNLDILNVSMDNNSDTLGEDAIRVQNEGTANADVLVSGGTYNNIELDVLAYFAQGTGTNTVQVTGITSTNGGGPDDVPNGGGIVIVGQNGSTTNFTISNNTLSNVRGEGVQIVGLAGAANTLTMNGTISNNVITSGNADGIDLDFDGLGVGSVINGAISVTGNNISFDDDGIGVDFRDAAGTMNVTISSNLLTAIVGDDAVADSDDGIFMFIDDDIGAGIGNLNLIVTDNVFSGILAGNKIFVVEDVQDGQNGCIDVTGNLSATGTVEYEDTSGSLRVRQLSAAHLSGLNGGIAVTELGTPTYNGGVCF